MHGFLVRLAALAAIVAAALTAAAPLKAVPNDDRYTVTGIVSNLATLAPHVDPNLQNGWGLAASATVPGGSRTTTRTRQRSTPRRARSTRSSSASTAGRRAPSSA